MKFAILFVVGSLTLVGCSNTNPVRPESASSAPSASLTAPASPAVTAIHPTPDQGFGFNGEVSGFPTGRVFVSGGGTFDVASGFVRSSGGFSCLESVRQGPLSVSINPDDPGPCLQGQGVRWDTAELLTSPISFKCTGAVNESHPPVQTGAGRVVLQADFYRAGDGNDESFTAQMIVSDTEIAPGVNLWIQGVGCGNAIVNFSQSH